MGSIKTQNINSHKYLRQYPIIIVKAGISYYYIADFYCVKLKLIIEVDGPIHNFKKEYDTNRDLVMKQLGLVVLRFTNDELLKQIDVVVEKITAAVLHMQSST